MALNGKVVWITGASSGIGEALALECSRKGAKVVLSARNVEALERVKVSAAHPEDCFVVPMDVSKLDEMAARTKQAIDAAGPIDWLVLNAGVSQRSLAVETDISVVEQILRTNFLGPVALATAVLPGMIERRAGNIVVVSSLVGIIGTPLRSSYSASKHALHGYFDSLRAEVWRSGIQVNIICPGYVRTDVSKNALKGDGSHHGVMDDGTNKGLAPDDFARRMIDAVAAGREETYIGGSEMRGAYLKRFAPGLFSKFIRKAKVT